MPLKAKRLIASIVSLSLLANLFFVIYIVQIERNFEAQKESYEEQLEEINDEKEYFQDKYYKCDEKCIEYEQQMGVYRNEP